jgi:hypothetical protein
MDEERAFKEGDYARMKVDLVNNEIEWFKKSVKDKDYFSVGKIKLLSHFQGKLLYPAITMRHLDDTIRLVE